MKKEHVFSTIGLLLLWQIAAMILHNDILIPYPLDTMNRVASFFVDGSFYQSVGSTLLRVLKGYLLSLLIALFMVILTERFITVKRLFSPIQLITKTIPNISYMVIALIWLGNEGAVSAVSFMILFPVFYNAFANTLDQQGRSLNEVELLYPETFWMRLRFKVLPQLVPEVLKTGKTAAGLGLKVGIMAEILGQVRSGIGRRMNYARLYLDTTSIFAWTIIIILLSLILDVLFDRMYQQFLKHES
ncbi:MAG: ABC transporter permease subunit [Solobacterium sp.]|nr:ABC transporter permease subunit [Solobacterium sp.]